MTLVQLFPLQSIRNRALSAIIPLAQLVLKASFHVLQPSMKTARVQVVVPPDLIIAKSEKKKIFILIIYCDVKMSDIEIA